MDFNADFQRDVDFANKSLGKMGERVLAVARYNLEPNIFEQGY